MTRRGGKFLEEGKDISEFLVCLLVKSSEVDYRQSGTLDGQKSCLA